jgi:hypothetical protein
MRRSQLRLIDLPRDCERAFYDRVLEKVVDGLSRQTEVRAVYQLGGVKHPGISDLDVLVVVDDDGSSEADPLMALTDVERYAFTHRCSLVPASLADDLRTYALIGTCRRIHGTGQPGLETGAEPDHMNALRTQTALEFLVKNLLDLYVQVEYRVVKVRVFLQHLKGLRLDLSLLHVSNQPLVALVESALASIDEWFAIRDPESAVRGWCGELLPLLRQTVQDVSGEVRLSVPAPGPLRVAANMAVDAGRDVVLSRSGMRLPLIPGLDGRRQFNALHRLNTFRMVMPLEVAPDGSYDAERFAFLRRAKGFVHERFPAFSAPVPPLLYYAL